MPSPNQQDPARPLSRLLNELPSADMLAASYARQRQALSVLKKSLPAPLYSMIDGAIVRDQTLTLVVSHNAAAARLRVIRCDLLHRFSGEGWKIDQVLLKVQPYQVKAVKAAPPRPLPDPVSLDQMRRSLEAIENKPLKNELKRLVEILDCRQTRSTRT